MVRSSVSAGVEADLALLRETAERARTALACLFSSSAEFEAEQVRVHRQAARAVRMQRRRSAVWTAVLALAFLMI